MQNQVKIEKVLGVELKTGEGKWKDPNVVIGLIAKAMADPQLQQKAIQNLLFGIQGINPAMQLGKAWRRGEFKKGAGPTSAYAMLHTGEQDIIAGDLAKRMKSRAFKFQQSMIKLSNTMHTKMMPLFEKLADLLPTIAKALGWFIDNITGAIKILAVFKAHKFISGLRAGGAAATAAGLAGSSTATMNVRAGVVNVMGGGPGGGRGGAAIMPSGARELGPGVAKPPVKAGGWARGYAQLIGVLGPTIAAYLGFETAMYGYDLIKHGKKAPARGAGGQLAQKGQREIAAGNIFGTAGWARTESAQSRSKQTLLERLTAGADIALAAGGVVSPQQQAFTKADQMANSLVAKMIGVADVLRDAATQLKGAGGVPTTEKKIRAKTQGKGLL
jgi:hypothetical protein